MREKFMAFFRNCKRKILPLEVLESVCPGDFEYEAFVELVEAFAAEGILTEYAPKRRAYKNARLCQKYKLNTYCLQSGARQRLQEEIWAERFDGALDLSYYFQTGLTAWRAERPALRRLSGYLAAHGFPKAEATDQERSYQIFGDEKYLLEDGKTLLQRLGLEEKMKIANFPDPLMLAVHPAALQKEPFRYLAVENKAAYGALAEILPRTVFAGLIYGAGWKIAANLPLLARQIGLPEAEHRVYYFGDLDSEGIAIWHAVYEKTGALPALPFYRALLKGSCARGKTAQLFRPEAMAAFTAFFQLQEQEALRRLLADGCYYPQEGLDAATLEACWREMK